MQTPYVTHRRVEFRDTDAAGIMHFSTYFTYMEEVEHEFLRQLGTSVVMPLPATEGGSASEQPPAGSTLSWPRVAAQCQFSGTARFEEQLDIELRVVKLGTSSVTYGFRFRVAGVDIADGSVTSVCCRIIPGSEPESTPIPEPLRQQLLALWQTDD